MAQLNNKEVSLEGKSVIEVGEMLREAFITSENNTAELKLTPEEETQLAFDELKHPRDFHIPDNTMGQMLGLATSEAFLNHMEASMVNFSYSNRSFMLKGEVFKV